MDNIIEEILLFKKENLDNDLFYQLAFDCLKTGLIEFVDQNLVAFAHQSNDFEVDNYDLYQERIMNYYNNIDQKCFHQMNALFDGDSVLLEYKEISLTKLKYVALNSLLSHSNYTQFKFALFVVIKQNFSYHFKQNNQQFNQQLSNLISLIDQYHYLSYTKDIVLQLLLLEISRHIQVISTQENNFSDFHLNKDIFPFVKHQLFPWLEFVFQNIPDQNELVEQIKQKINFHVYHYYSQLRINNIFDIIVDFPESECAIDDLQVCISHTRQHHLLIVALTNAFQSRLLKAGTTTHLILDIYIKTVRSLKRLDPSGILLEIVTPSVRDYVRRRKDFLKCLVLKLIDDSPQGLFEELASSAHEMYVEHTDGSGGEANMDHSQWLPKPIYTIPNQNTTRNSSNLDLISNLVNLTTGKEVLVNQYIDIIHHRLLTVKDYDCDKEIQQVEFLKMKFGEQHLHKCEVMLKDIADSKRVNEYLTKTLIEKKQHDLSFASQVIIISGLFWPSSLSKEQFQFSKQVANYFAQYAKEYEAWKSRSLNWQSELGVVELQLELDGKVQDLTVTPFQANVILLFSEKSEWSISEIANELSIPLENANESLLPRLSFWVNKGFIKRLEEGSKEVYCVVQSSSSIKEESFHEDTHTNHSAEDDHLLKLHTITKQFVVGMCKNQGSATRPVPAMRIHMMLPMVLPKELQYSVYFKDLDSLIAFMDKLVKEGTLDSSKAGYWCI